jgi:hypothetical protein
MRRKRQIATREVLSLMELLQEMQDHGCGLTATTPSTIISGTRFKMALSPFILPQQKTCLQTSSPNSAMKRLTPSAQAIDGLVTEGLRHASEGVKEKSTGLASTVASHTLPLLPSVRQPKFSVSPASVLFFRLSPASVHFGLAFS